MNSLQLSSQFTDKQASALRNQRLSERHYNLLFSETIAVYRKTGAVLAVLLKNVISSSVLDEAYPHLLTMRGDLSNRASVIRSGAQMSGIRVDGLPSARKRVPKEVLRAHGGQGNQLGFFDFNRQSQCRETKWTASNPEALVGCLSLIFKVDELYRRTCPIHYARQMAKVDDIAPSLKIASTNFTTLTVNFNNRTAAHTDEGDVRDGLGCLTTHGNFRGGYFIMPKYEVAFDVQPGDLLLADVHQLHGNGAMSGERTSCVFYAREKMHLCKKVA
jgi:hypothetical protein